MSIEGFAVTTLATTLFGAAVGGGAGCCGGCTVTCFNPLGGVAGGFMGAAVGGAIGFFAPAVIYSIAKFAQALFRGVTNAVGFVGKNIYSVVYNHPILTAIALLTLLVLLKKARDRRFAGADGAAF